MPKSEPKRLYRSESDQVIAGVCAGLAEYFDLDATIVRLIFALLFVFGGSGILLYIVLWVILPKKSHSKSTKSETYIKANSEEIKQKAEHFAENFRSKDTTKHNTGALLLIAVGSLFLANNLGFFRWFDVGRMWPLILVLLGVSMLWKKTK